MSSAGLRSDRYTLLEVIIVLVLLVMVVTIVLPRVGVVPLGLRVSQMVDRVHSAFHAAASIALATGEPVKISFDFGSQKIRLDSQPSSRRRPTHSVAADDYDAASFFDQLKIFDLPDGVGYDEDFESAEENRGGLLYQFFPNGEASGPKIRLMLGRRRFTLDVDRLTGRPILFEKEY